MKLIPLGTAGFIPTNGKETASYLIILDKSAILLDTGTGVKRLPERNIEKHLKKISELHIIFSHLHHDHTAGFTWLLRLWTKELVLHLPTEPFVQFNGIKALSQLTSSPFFALEVSKWSNIKEIKAIDSSEIIIDKTKLQFIPQQHSGGSVGIRINNFSYITDTESRKEIHSFIDGSDLLFIDTMHDKKDYMDMKISHIERAQHGYSIGNANIAKEANIKRMGLIHIDPLYDNKRITNLVYEAKSVFKNSYIPEEGKLYEL